MTVYGTRSAQTASGEGSIMAMGVLAFLVFVAFGILGEIADRVYGVRGGGRKWHDWCRGGG